MDGKAVRLPHDQNRHIHADDHVQPVKRLVDAGLGKIAFKRGVAVADGQDVYRDCRAFSTALSIEDGEKPWPLSLSWISFVEWSRLESKSTK